MKKGNRSFKVGKIQGGIYSLLLIFCLTIPSYSWVDNSVFKTESKELPVSGQNNVAFASGRYIFVAPSEPSIDVDDDTPFAKYDNNSLLLFDSKKVTKEPDIYSLGNCYFPTLVLHDADTKTVFVKGTEFVQTDTGEYKSYAVIKYLQFNLSDDGKPVASEFPNTIRIPGFDDDDKGMETAPDFIANNKKDVVIFSNGASIFTYNRNEGFLYRVNFIKKDQYDPVNHTITNLSFDSESNVVTVLINKKIKSDDNQWTRYSELYFYELDNGTLNLLKKLDSEALPVGVSVPDGSTIAINSEGENVDAYFVGTDGVLYQTRLTVDTNLSGSALPLASFDQLRQSSVDEHLSAVSTYYRKETQVFELLKSGYTAYIHRPLNSSRGRIGKIHRPLNLRFTHEEPALVLAQFGKKNKLIQKSFSAEIDQQGGIFMFSDHSGNRYAASYQGNVYELNMAQGVNDATLNLLGGLGSRLNSVADLPDRGVWVAVKECELGDEDLVKEFGSLVVARRREESNFLSFVNWTENNFSFNPVIGVGIGSIRRPCNLRLQ
jgi:hypothetical protein